MTSFDFEHRGLVEIDDEAGLRDVFRSHEEGHLRVIGSGTRQSHLPPPPPDTTLVSLRALNRIERLEAPDLTCSVQPGCARAELDEELDRVGLELPCPGTGTIGGLFAADPFGPFAAGGLTPRSLLLGMDAVLPEGLSFRTGARVVKNVAGFDLSKLFVGSRGQLFTASLLHIKLRPKPAASAWFLQDGLQAESALALFRGLRLEALPPTHLVLLRSADGKYGVHGQWKGRARFVAGILDRLGLAETPAPAPVQLEHVEPGTEVLRGQLRCSTLPRLLDSLPDDASLLVRAGGGFEVALTPPDTDRLLSILPELSAAAEVARGVPERRGHATPHDPGAHRLRDGLKAALDPRGVLS